ncbi:MAG: alpha/beta hydrolase, partial [Acidimicrobiales bacterium]|nr:alpha/beta hydrolase [Acidimicrobiales bacterium]
MPPFEVGTFESFGVELYYEIHGHGPRVLVFMHGILLDSNMNRRIASDLAALGHRVVLLDLPGHGHSEKPTRASYHRMDTYARHVVSLLDHLGIDQAVVGGVSLGGNVSLMVAAQNPERVRGM